MLNALDWLIIGSIVLVTLAVGLWAARTSGTHKEAYFLSNRSVPWWLLGISMVATTFSSDTPNLVTDLVRQQGVAGNWVWWAFLLTGMVTVFLYARLWRRSGMTTDLEFYELRYSGRSAAFLRGFRAMYLGFLFNGLIMGLVLLSAVKLSAILLGWGSLETLLLVGGITLFYSAWGGLKSVLWTDLLLFITATFGSIFAAWYLINLPQVGGLKAMLDHPAVALKMSFFPDPRNSSAMVQLLVIPLCVQWWAAWYPGSEPGGGGYVVQRILAAKDENNAVHGTLLFNLVHYAIRPWPWILVALASLVVFPQLADIQAAFPSLDPRVVKHDIAYPAMLTFLPNGLLGLVVASLIAAVMSTLSTHLVWGSSYLTSDFYIRFIRQNASPRETVFAGRMFGVGLMFVGALLATWLENALQAFQILLQIGAGTGLLFLLRWFWWRINALCEIVAMVVSFTTAVSLQIWASDVSTDMQFLIVVGVTTTAWVLPAFLTKGTDEKVLQEFCEKIHPLAWGWGPYKKYIKPQVSDAPGPAFIQISLGSVSIYALLFSTGYCLYGEWLKGILLGTLAILCGILLIRSVGLLEKLNASLKDLK